MRLRRLSVVVLTGLVALLVPKLDAGAYGQTAPGGCESNTSGDFNGDDSADLAIGSPGAEDGQGAVSVIYGDETGLNGDESDDYFTQDDPSAMEDVAEDGDHFGACLAVGNFNGDGFDDLAIGVPDEDVGSVLEAGAVQVIYGASNGLSPSNTTHADQLFTQNSSGIEGSSETGDHFGHALASGDFNIDERDDLAVGVPDEDVGSIPDAGSVNVIHGSGGTVGLNASKPLPDQLWFQDSTGLSGTSESNDEMGAALATGDMNGDGREDLAAGDPGESVGTKGSAGAVNVLYGSVSAGLNANNDQLWFQDSTGVAGLSESGDKFGDAVNVFDYDADGFADLAVGAPTEDVADVEDAGAVNRLFGSSNRLTATDNDLLTDDANDAAEEGDQFGAALAAGDIQPEIDVSTFLLVAAPGEDDDTGQVTLFSDGGDLVYTDPNTGATGDRFGSALTVGDYFGDTVADFVVGSPFREVGSEDDAGQIVAFYDLGFSGDATFVQDDLDNDASDTDDNFGSALG